MLNYTQLRNSLIIFSVFLFLSFAFPLHIHPYRMYCNDLLVIIGLALMIGYWACVPKITLRIPKIVIAPISLIVIIVVQTSNNYILYPADMTFPVLYLLCFAIALICGATIALQENGVSHLCSLFAICFISSGVLSVVIQHIQLLNLDLFPWIVTMDWSVPLRPYANFAQPNTLALTLCFAVVSVWYLFLLNKIKPAYAFTLVLFLLWGLALTQSRIAWIILPLFTVLTWKEAIQGAKVYKLVLLMCVALFIGFVIIAPVFLHSLGGIVESVENRAGQTSVRFVLWQQALAMSIEYPWLGVGWFQFGPHQVMMAASFKPTEYSDYAHNILFNFAAEIGWPLTLLFVAGLFIWAYQCCVRKWRNLQVRFISLVFVAIGVHSMVEFPLWSAFILMPFGLMLGVLHTEKLGWETIKLGRAWLAGISVVSLMAMTVITLDYRKMAAGFDAIARIQAGDKRYLGNIKKPEFTLFPQFYDYFHIVEIQTTTNMPPKDIDFLGRISMRFGFAPVLDRLALAYSNNQRPRQALHVLTIIQRIDTPAYEDIYFEWRDYAKRYPAMYGDIFKYMPKPDFLETEKD